MRPFRLRFAGRFLLEPGGLIDERYVLSQAGRGVAGAVGCSADMADSYYYE